MCRNRVHNAYTYLVRRVYNVKMDPVYVYSGISPMCSAGAFSWVSVHQISASVAKHILCMDKTPGSVPATPVKRIIVDLERTSLSRG